MEPENFDQFLELFNKNQRFSGYGLGVTAHLPCPFCAAPDMFVYEVMVMEQALSDGSVCNNCNRGVRAIIKKEEGAVSFQLVQTSGPEQPEWHKQKMPLDEDYG